MALLPQDRQSQVMLLIIMLMAGGGGGFWNYWAQPPGQQIQATRGGIDNPQRVIHRAQQGLGRGPVEGLPRQVEEDSRGDLVGRAAGAAFGDRVVGEAGAPPPGQREGRAAGAGGGAGSGRITAVLVALLAAGPLAAQAKPKPAPPARPDSAKPVAAKPDSGAAPGLVREQYSYEGGGRDPFLSPLKSGDIRQLLPDLPRTSP